jgi:transposase-like protein
VSRVIATLKGGLEAWRTCSLADLEVVYVYLDGFALRVRSAGKVVGVPVLGIVGVLADGRKHLLERLHEEFRRRVKTQGSLPNEDAALILLFSLVASGQIKLRRIDGWRKIAAVLSQQVAA